MSAAIAVLIAVMSFTACSSDSQSADPEAYAAEKALNEKYFNLVCGEWENDSTTELSKRHEYYRFSSDNTYLGIVRLIHRDTVMVNGTKTYTDWKTTIADTTQGKWKLMIYDNCPVLTTSSYMMKFSGANDSVLYVNSVLFEQMKRRR